ncbi:hypothetical protein Pan258_01940 [Symmachiella dynata]|uniref:hypothetical protein n=1 Tax=Symmachiella dynata TaxID=2527995 RepID=UPI00118BDDE0|nr:hypothetical protein [Symmachiella dynata]QDT46177.1 hypothetical protein Pan258_01940 [Symmachiella dynata]
MTKVQFRTAEERDRAQWADKFTAVAEGNLYRDKNSPFPIHEYFKLGLLGKEVRMLELNAGAALVDHMVADALTELNISSETEGNADEIKDWHKSIFYQDTLEQTARSFFSCGYAAQQVVRDIDPDTNENTYTIITLNSKTWYPTVPTFKYQEIREGRVVSIFSENNDGVKSWYAFVERHTKGNVEHELYKLENGNDLEGTKLKIKDLDRFKELEDSVATDLNHIPIFQIDMTRGAGKYFGQSIFAKIWGNLQEISEIKTQMRMERIKHFRSLLAAPAQSLQRAQRVDDGEALPNNSKQARVEQYEHQATFDLRQEIMAVPPGAQMPQFIQRDLEIITKAMEMIRDCLSEIASVTGCPRSVFNLDEKGTIHVETEKKKDRKYVQRITQCQKKLEWITEQGAKTYFQWKGDKAGKKEITAELDSAFEMTLEEKVDLYRKMNSDGKFISQEEAVRNLFPDMTEEERTEMLQKIQDEDKSLAGSFGDPVPVEL